MSKHSLTITYALPAAAAVTDGYWLRLEQEDVAEDVATVGDAATVIDSLFQLDACNPESVSVVTELGQSNPLQALYPTSEEAAAALVTAAAEIDLAICDQESDGSVTVRIRVIRSHPAEPYRLRISGGTEVEAIQTVTEISRTVTVQDATSHTLDYPVIAGFSGRWMGNVIARADQIPAISRIGNTLHWTDPATGTISCSYLTQYDLVTVRVAGVDGHQGAAMVRCFYHGLVEELEPELPEPAEEDASLCAPGNFRIDLPEDRVTCYKTIVTTKRCGCSKKEIASTTHDQVVPCPEWGPVRCPGTATDCMHQLGTEAVTEYVECTDDGDSTLARSATYQELCCNASPPTNLPDCRVETRTWKGGVPIVNGVDYYRQIYGRAVRIVPVAPNGGICGEWTIKQEVRITDCCDLVDPPVWDNGASVSVMANNEDGTVFFIGGLAPYRVRLTGVGFWLNPARTVRDQLYASPVVVIYTSIACGSCKVDLEDACGIAAVGYVRATTGRWVDRPDLAGACSTGIISLGVPAATDNPTYTVDYGYVWPVSHGPLAFEGIITAAAGLDGNFEGPGACASVDGMTCGDVIPRDGDCAPGTMIFSGLGGADVIVCNPYDYWDYYNDFRIHYVRECTSNGCIRTIYKSFYYPSMVCYSTGYEINVRSQKILLAKEWSC